MTDLVEFIEARLIEDERLARRAGALCGCHPPALSWQFGEGATDGRIVAEGDGHPDVRPRGRLARRWSTSYNDMFAAEHIVRHDPARVLRDVEAKRRMLARHQPVEVWAGHDHIPPGQLGARMMIFVNCSSCIVNHDPEGKDYDCQHGEVEWPCPEVCDLAAAYADHPDYLAEWSPESVVPSE